MILPATRSSRFAARSVDIGRTSSDERKREGHTISPVLELINCEPRVPGITIRGRFPVRVRASLKMRSRLGVRFAEMHAEDVGRTSRTSAKNAEDRGLSGRVLMREVSCKTRSKGQQFNLLKIFGKSSADLSFTPWLQRGDLGALE